MLWLSVCGLLLLAGLISIGMRVAKPVPLTAKVATRAKGGLGLHVFRATKRGAEEVLSGEAFAAGDHLRFAVDLPEEGFIKIIGIESTGRYFVAWPQSGAVSTLLPAGSRLLLDGAVRLDESQGRETLYLVTCPPNVGSPSCESLGSHMEPYCTEGCSLSPFVLDKGP